eukprot:c15490_g1_i1.p1 GENE.c15490_g1_i1~~c15490_g1_i1.p1  ORF type:complete len:290 (+),score=124.81 c15490_g1_i1:57-926(+)
MSSIQQISASRIQHHVNILNSSSNTETSQNQNQSQSQTPKVILVVGCGSGVGEAIGQKFAFEGYIVVFLRRSNEEEAKALQEKIKENGGTSYYFICDASKPEVIIPIIEKVEKDIGPIEVAVYNIGANMGLLSLEKTTYKNFELAWRIGSLGAFIMAKEVSPHMVKRGHGTIIFTGATASVRGARNHHAHTNAMQGRRGLAQSLFQELAPKGIHVCHCILDGLVDSPGTVGKLFPEQFKQAQEEANKNYNIIRPSEVANAYWFIHSQHPSSWTFELDIRPWKTQAWFHS